MFSTKPKGNEAVFTNRSEVEKSQSPGPRCQTAALTRPVYPLVSRSCHHNVQTGQDKERKESRPHNKLPLLVQFHIAAGQSEHSFLSTRCSLVSNRYMSSSHETLLRRVFLCFCFLHHSTKETAEEDEAPGRCRLWFLAADLRIMGPEEMVPRVN